MVSLPYLKTIFSVSWYRLVEALEQVSLHTNRHTVENFENQACNKSDRQTGENYETQTYNEPDRQTVENYEN